MLAGVVRQFAGTVTVWVVNVALGVRAIGVQALAPPGVITSVGLALLPVSWCAICNVTLSIVTVPDTAGFGVESVRVWVDVSVETVATVMPSTLVAAFW